uniref:Putative secreted protein n=1 Tax=Psorophora albipes TaxID=869069 RepID=T1D5G2_9DIPT
MKLYLITTLAFFGIFGVVSGGIFDSWFNPSPQPKLLCPKDQIPVPNWPSWLPGRFCVPEKPAPGSCNNSTDGCCRWIDERNQSWTWCNGTAGTSVSSSGNSRTVVSQDIE